MTLQPANTDVYLHVRVVISIIVGLCITTLLSGFARFVQHPRRERVSFLQDKTAHRLMTTGADGQPSRMTDEEFDAAVKDAQDAADKYCQ